MPVWLTKTLRWCAYLSFTMLCAGVAAYGFAFLFGEYRAGNPFDAQFSISGLDVPAHFFGAGLALLLAPFQLSAWIRRRVPRLHRLSGGLYAAGILIAGLAGLSLARHTQGGIASGTGFALLAAIWIAVTGIGIGYAIAGDTPRHRRWMWRSIALTSSAVTLRLMLGVGTGALHLPFQTVYIFAAWGCWTFNLAICELLLHWPQLRARWFADRAMSAADVLRG